MLHHVEGVVCREGLVCREREWCVGVWGGAVCKNDVFRYRGYFLDYKLLKSLHYVSALFQILKFNLLLFAV